MTVTVTVTMTGAVMVPFFATVSPLPATSPPLWLPWHAQATSHVNAFYSALHPALVNCHIDLGILSVAHTSSNHFELLIYPYSMPLRVAQYAPLSRSFTPTVRPFESLSMPL